MGITARPHNANHKMSLVKGSGSAHMCRVDRRINDLAAPVSDLAPASDLLPRKCEFDSRPFAGWLAIYVEKGFSHDDGNREVV